MQSATVVGRVEDDEAFAQKEPLLASCYAASIRYLTALGHRAGQQLMRVFSELPTYGDTREERTVAGFNLHVSIPIEGDDRRGLERQLRYMGRPPLSEERLSKTSDGKIVVKLKSKWSDGTSHVILSPTEFLERLVALIPPPRKNLIRYSGVFAPNAKLRKAIVPKTVEDAEVHCENGNHGKTTKHFAWAKLMARVFDIDVLECPRCKSKMQTISFITEPGPIKDILASMRMATAPPEAAKSSFVLEQTHFDYDYAE
jgi:hypothetical protein